MLVIFISNLISVGLSGKLAKVYLSLPIKPRSLLFRI